MTFSAPVSTGKILAASLVAGVFIAGPACVPAINPCDPNAPESVQQRARIAGVVHDQADRPVPGVQLFLTQTGQSTESGPDGTFAFVDVLPQDAGYDVASVVNAPLQGGQVHLPPLACGEDVEDLVVRVAVPPPAPEVEIVRATSKDRLFVAFGATKSQAVPAESTDSNTTPQEFVDACQGGDTVQYHVELREPFGTWQRALVRTRPVFDEDEAEIVDSADLAFGDACGRVGCGFFAYAFEDLVRKDNARCAEVVGWLDENGERSGLEAYGQYEVRVRADLVVENKLRAQTIPGLVVSDASAQPEELTLTPTTVMPVTMSEDPDTNAGLLDDVEIQALVPVSADRFAAINGQGLAVIGAGEGDVGVAADIFGGVAFDAQSSEAGDAEVTSGGLGGAAQALAILPAGRWVRVWKRLPDVDGTSTSMIDKVFVGLNPEEAPANNSPEQPVFNVDMGMDQIANDFLGFRWMTAPDGDPLGAGYNPPDAYLLAFSRGIALVEYADGESLTSGVTTGDDGNGLPGGNPGAGDDYYMTEGDDGGLLDPRDVLGGDYLCSGMVNAMGTNGEDGEGQTHGACLDLRLYDPNARLSDVEILRGDVGASAVSETFHVMADVNSDTVYVIRSDDLLGAGMGSDPEAKAVDFIQPVRVGFNPVALQSSVILECGDGPEVRHSALYVANAGSADLSVLVVDGSLTTSSVQEHAVVPLPTAPARFFADPGGPTCDDPYLWVVGDDGRMFPVDVRAGHFGLPVCGTQECAVETRNRAQAGAVGRRGGGPGRVMIGGSGMLGEVGFLRPQRLNPFEELGSFDLDLR